MQRRKARPQRERHVGVAAIKRVAERCLHVGPPRDKRVTGRLGALGADTRRRLLRDLGKVGGVPPCRCRRRLVVQPRPRIGAQGLKHPVAARGLAVGLHHRVLAERDEQLEHIRLRQSVPAADLLGVLEPEDALEHRQPPEQLPLGRPQQRVAGFDRRIQRAAAEHCQALVEALRDRPRRQRPQPGGGQLERQRQPVQPPADPPHRLHLGTPQAPTRPRRPRALHE